MRFTIPNTLLLFLLLAGNFAFAQQGQNSTPGAILQYNSQSWSQPGDLKPDVAQPANQIPRQKTPNQPPPVEIEDEQEQPMSPNDSLQIFIRDIHVEGNTLLPSSAVEAVLAPARNKNLRFVDMQALADRITNLYIKAGYVNSQGYIPVQNFNGQILRLKVMETKVAEVVYEPARWYPRRAVFPRIALQSGDPVNVNKLSRSIRLINENPDLTLIGRLKKGQETGSTDIHLVGQSRFPLHLTPFLDNLGRRSIGNLRMGVSTVDNNLLGFGDISTSVVSFTKSSFGFVQQYTVPLGPYGTRIGMNYAYSNVKLGGSLKPLDIHSRSQVFTPLISHALIITDRAVLNGSLGFDFKNLNTDLLGERFHRDRLRVLRPSLDGYVNDRWGRTYFNQDVGLGLAILGGSVGNSSLASRQGAGTKFFSMSGSVTRVQKLPHGMTGVLRGRYQYSPDRLVSAEQFQIGGAYTVRGYSEGRQLGDMGYLLNAEWYVPAFFIPAHLKLPFVSRPLQQLIQVVGFTDFGESSINRPLSGQDKNNFMLGCGGGLRIQLNRLLVIRADLGFPLIRQGSDELRPRIHVGLQSTLF
jgi:hemolysin activation/secretion protein